jgi:hypothetical protein
MIALSDPFLVNNQLQVLQKPPKEVQLPLLMSSAEIMLELKDEISHWLSSIPGRSQRQRQNKKVCSVCFDSQRRPWNDEKMFDSEFEGDGTNRDAYLTDLDAEAFKRAEHALNAIDEEKGPSTRFIGQPARPSLT